MRGTRILTGEEINKLLPVMDFRMQIYVLVACTFGLRVSEMLRLTFRDFIEDTVYLRRGKDSWNETAIVPEPVKKKVRKLRKWYKDQDRFAGIGSCIFLSREGENRPLTRQQVSNLIRNAVVEVGLSGKVNTHSFRKTYVNAIYNKTGKDIAKTQKYSGHKQIGNLIYYIQTMESLDLISEMSDLIGIDNDEVM